MLSNNYRNIAKGMNIFFVVFMLVELSLNWLVLGHKENPKIFSLWMGINILFYFINYKYLVAYFFKKEFNVTQLLKLFFVFLILKSIVSVAFRYFIHLYILDESHLVFNFASCLMIYQSSLFWFLLSTSTRVILMLENNELEIENLNFEKSKLSLKKMQTGIQAEVISKYITYLQEKNKQESISEEIVELAEFMRYTTYDSLHQKASFSDEYMQLQRYCSVLEKSSRINVTLEKAVTKNLSINAFALLLPLKELLLKFPNLTKVNLSFEQINEIIYAKFVVQNSGFGDYESQFSKVNSSETEWKVECPTR
jgi:hypothetical protein